MYKIIFIFKVIPLLCLAGILLYPANGCAIQLHASSEGIITHQIGHLFFLFSMVVLIFIIRGKRLIVQDGWRMIQCAAFFFILWNLNTLTAHFLDNQIHVIKMETLSFSQVRITTHGNSSALAWMYYVLKLDHLLCVPAMFFLYKGLSTLVKEQQAAKGDT